MHKTTIALAGSTVALLAAAAPAFALPVGAEARLNARAGIDGGVASTTIEARAEARAEARTERMGDREEKAKQRGTNEIDRRIQILTNLNTKVADMHRVSGEGKSTIDAMVQAQIAALTDLKARIQADDSTTTLKADMQAITKSYRIFALVIPQGHIKVAADKVHTTATTMATVSAKLATRLSDAASAGSDVASLQLLQSGIAAKLAVANASADAAVSLTANLQPDNGDKTVMAANEAALKDARAKIQDALKTLQDVRSDVHDIIMGLKGLKLDGQATTSAAIEQQ